MKQEKKRGEKPLWTLFFSMLKIGLFTFGGGYAMLALFEAEFVARKKWVAKDEFLDMVAIAESTPGPLAINGATYIGYKVAGVFVPVVMALAVVSAIIWALCGRDIEFVLNIFVSVLVVACPCSLGLATPTAIMVGTGRGAEMGVLYKSGEALQAMAFADTVVLDKTGTVTEGKPKLSSVYSVLLPENELLGI